ncbi:MAG: twin-arginine translocase subunit TatC [Verrucomicrobiota bacterium]
MSDSDSDDPNKDDLPDPPEDSPESQNDAGTPPESPDPENKKDQESSSSDFDEGPEIVETNPVDPFGDSAEDYDHEDHDYDHYEDGLPDAEHYECDDSKDPFEAVASSIEENLETNRKRLGSGGNEMSFLEHLEDLRGTIFKSLIAFLVMAVIMGAFFPYIAEILKSPLVRAYGSHEEAAKNLITYRPFEVFTVFIQAIFMGALALSLPFILYFVAQFIAPGLTDKEKSVLRPGMTASFGLFLLGVGITYYLILPMALYFIIFFAKKAGWEQMWSAGEYYSMVVWMCLGVGTLFQFPLVLILLCYVGILSPEILRNSRRLVVVIVMIVAALITPGGDPLTLLLLAAPLYGLFELSIIVAAFVDRKQRAELVKGDG